MTQTDPSSASCTESTGWAEDEIEKTRAEANAKRDEIRAGIEQWASDPSSCGDADSAAYLWVELRALEQRLQEQKKNAKAYDKARAMGLRPSPDDEWRVALLEGLGKYEVSKGGFIRNWRTGKPYKRRVVGRKLYVSLIRENGSPLCMRVADLVAATWLLEKPTGHLEFKNGKVFDCRADNLRWV